MVVRPIHRRAGRELQLTLSQPRSEVLRTSTLLAGGRNICEDQSLCGVAVYRFGPLTLNQVMVGSIPIDATKGFSMTVGDLIKELAQYSVDTEVVIVGTDLDASNTFVGSFEAEPTVWFLDGKVKLTT